MRPGPFALALLFCGAVLSGVARAQGPVPWEVDGSSAPWAPPAGGIPEGYTCPAVSPPVWSVPENAVPPLAPGQQQIFNTELLVGLPTAVRLQAAVARHENYSFLLEGFAGVYVIAPLVGAGGRFGYTPYCGRKSAFVVRPGVDACFAVNPFPGLGGTPGVFALATDVEFAWFHAFGGNGLELGLDLGTFTVHKAAGGWGVLPLVSAFIGFRF